MTPSERLVSDPENFLKHSILDVGIHFVHSGRMWASLADRSNQWTVTRRSTVLGRLKSDGGMFELTPAVGPPPLSFRINWCGYKQNSFHGLMLQHPPNLMFTATMDGCTFGIGSTTPGGDRLVGHFNIGPDPTGGTDVEAMAFAARTTFGAGARLLDKTQYMVQYGAPGGAPAHPAYTVQTTTVGFFEGRAWRFFHQRYRQTGNYSFEILDVRPIR